MVRQQPGRDSAASKVAQAYAQAGKYVNLGLQFAITILVCLFLGRWLDNHLGTSPGLLLVGTFFGAGAGFYNMYKALMSLQEQERREEQDECKQD
jgi:F0F1-type ATP synthase assembly protein I